MWHLLGRGEPLMVIGTGQKVAVDSQGQGDVGMPGELYAPLYTIGQPTELAIAQCTRIEFAELIKDMVRRGLSALEQEQEKEIER